MKRIKAACLLQTVHFQINDGMASEYNKQAIQKEYESYKQAMSKRNVKFKILEEQVQPDGSLIIKIQKQNNQQAVGDYF